MRNPIVPLKVVSNASIDHYASAAPILTASAHTIDYTCGDCGTVLMRADQGQVHSFCSSCGAYNSTDSEAPLLPPHCSPSLSVSHPR